MKTIHPPGIVLTIFAFFFLLSPTLTLAQGDQVSKEVYNQFEPFFDRLAFFQALHITDREQLTGHKAELEQLREDLLNFSSNFTEEQDQNASHLHRAQQMADQALEVLNTLEGI